MSPLPQLKRAWAEDLLLLRADTPPAFLLPERHLSVRGDVRRRPHTTRGVAAFPIQRWEGPVGEKPGGSLVTCSASPCPDPPCPGSADLPAPSCPPPCLLQTLSSPLQPLSGDRPGRADRLDPRWHLSLLRLRFCVCVCCFFHADTGGAGLGWFCPQGKYTP